MRIACWQAETTTVASGLRDAARRAAEAGAELLVTPEMSLTGYHLGPARLRAVAEPVGGPRCAAAAAVAAEFGLALVFGWPEAHRGAIYNSVQLVDSTGARRALYRKAHLYGDLDGSVFTPGDVGVVQAELGALRVGLLVCYDVEFPEAVRAHAVAGTGLLVVPTALMRPWRFVAETMVPTRAFENRLFLAYTNWAGRERELSYCGLSRVVGPDGVVLAEAGERSSLLVADLDPGAPALARQAVTYLHDRRPALFAAWTTGSD